MPVGPRIHGYAKSDFHHQLRSKKEMHGHGAQYTKDNIHSNLKVLDVTAPVDIRPGPLSFLLHLGCLVLSMNVDLGCRDYGVAVKRDFLPMLHFF